MSKYPVQYETLHKREEGWYFVRDLEGSGFGQYLYKRFQFHSDSEVFNEIWVEPVVPSFADGPVIVYFPTKTEAIEALSKLVKAGGSA